MSRPSKIAIVKELGSRSPRCLAAHTVRGSDEPELVVVERYPAALGAEALAILEEDTRDLATLEHANVATIIASVKLKGDVAVLSEWVDGESLEAILAAPQKPSLEVLLRVILDVLEGLSALHAFGEGRVCGAAGSDDVFVGVDGVTRLARFGLGRIPPGVQAPRRLASMAPEFLRGERSPRGDVFTVGTLLWECFMGERLFATPTSLEQQRERLVTKAPPVDPARREAWASALGEVIERALAIDPAARWASTSELSRAISAAVPSKVASRANVSQYVARAFGERIEARFAKLEPKVNLSLSSMMPSTTAPPPAVEVSPAPKLPEVTPEVKAPVAAVPAKPAEPAADKPVEAGKPAEARKPAEAAKAPEAAKPHEAGKLREAARPLDAKTEAAKAPEATKLPASPKAPAPEAAKSHETKPEAAKSPAAKSPAAAKPAAAKNVPLPKRMPSQPDSAPRLVQAPTSSPDLAAAAKAAAPGKTNGSTVHAAMSAKSAAAVVPKKAVPLPAASHEPRAPQRSEPKLHAALAEPSPIVKPTPARNEAPAAETKAGNAAAAVHAKAVAHEAELSFEPAPESAREELDVDVDLISVRPPPAAAVEAPVVEEPARETAAAAPAMAAAPARAAPRDEKPATAPVREKPAAAVPAPAPASAVEADDAEHYAKRSPYRGPLLVLGGIVLLAGGFAAGRLTAPDPWPAIPASTVTATAATSATASATVTATASVNPAASATPPLTPAASGSADLAKPIETAASANATATAPSAAPTTMAPSDSAKPEAPAHAAPAWTAPTARPASSGRYDPGAI